MLPPEVYVTSDIVPGSLTDIDLVADLYNQSQAKLKLWIHIDTDDNGGYKLYGKSDANYSLEDAEQIVNTFFNERMSNYWNMDDDDYTQARQAPSAESAKSATTQERCPDPQYCSLWGLARGAYHDNLEFGKTISCYCCFIDDTKAELSDNLLREYGNYYLGVGMGVLDGAAGTIAALVMLAEGVHKFKENTVFTPEWFIDLYRRSRDTGGWLEATGEKFWASLEFAGQVAQFVISMVVNIGSILSAIGTALKNFFVDLSPHTGLLRTGYSLGIVLFEIIMEIITSGTAGIAKLGGSLAKISFSALRDLLNPANYANWFDGVLKRRLWNPVDGSTPLTHDQLASRGRAVCAGEFCFVAGTLIAMSAGVQAQPIEQVRLFDRVESYPIERLHNIDEVIQAEVELELVSYSQLYADNAASSDDWYKAELVSLNHETRLTIARPKVYFSNIGLSDAGDTIRLVLPELGVDDLFRARSLLPITSEEEDILGSEGAGNVVTATIKNRSSLVLNLITSGGDTIGVTPEHRFYSEDRQEWVAAEELVVGERLRSQCASEYVRRIDTLSTTRTAVYNLEVRKDHNYFVGSSQLLVHNSYIDGILARAKDLRSGQVPQNLFEQTLKRLSEDDLRLFIREMEDALPNWRPEVDIKLVRAWEVLYDFPSLRRSVPDLEVVSRFLADNPSITGQAIADQLKNVVDPYKIINGLKNGVLRRYRLKTPVDESIISSIRNKYDDAITEEPTRNAAYAVGEIDDIPVDLESISGGGQAGDVWTDFGNFEPGPAHYSGDPGLPPRINHTEQKIADYLRSQLDPNFQAIGELTIVSQRRVCNNCDYILDQFQTEFPHIVLTRVQLKN